MANTKKKIISGAMYSKPNLEHNLREHIPPNSVEERRYLNLVYTKDEDITLEQVYDKLFAASYQEWREKEIKKGRGKRFPKTYYEKIKQDKQKHLTYEIIWQIGDMRDTGFNLNLEDADKAQALLDDFAIYLLELPEVCVVTQKELDDPEWKPPFDAGLVVHHMTYHGDENSPHIHMTYIPYTTHSKSGAPVQNVFSQMFEDIGYPTTMRQATTESGELVWQTDKNGNQVPQMKRNKHGGVDWVETQKMVLQKMMMERLGWDRLYKGSNPRGNMELSDYRRERAAEAAKEAELELEAVMDKVVSGQEALKVQTEQLETLASNLQKGYEAEERLTTKIADKYAKLEKVEQDLTDKTNEVERQVQKLDMLQEDADKAEKRAVLAEQIYDYFKDTPASEREHEYFERIMDLTYENGNLKAENQELKRENSRLREKLEKAYDFMRQFTIGGMNMLEKFLRSIGEWVQQKVAGLSR